jgi:hypothetical protein
MIDADELLSRSRRPLVLGIGGGGDVVGALGAAIHCLGLGIPALVGGVTWERRPIDPVPGPRRLDEIVDPVRQLSDCAVLAGPGTRTDHGAHFAEARMAEHLSTPTVLVAVDRGPAAIADGLAEAAAALDADLLIFVDVGGDVLADGTEPGLASPLCDAVMLAAGALMEQRGLTVAGAVFGPCCDGELTVEEVLDHLARVGAASGLLGTRAIDPAMADELEAAAAAVPTEASAQAIRCARGEIGTAMIRNGRRSVPLSPLGGTIVYFDPAAALGATARLARALLPATSLDEANELLHDLGVSTELDYERAQVEQ